MSSIWSEDTSPGRHHFVDLVDGDIAALLGGLDHLLHAGIGEIEKRQRSIGRAFFLLRGFFFSFACVAFALLAIPLLLDRPGRHTPGASPRGARPKGPRRRGAAPESGLSVSSEPAKLRLTQEHRWNRPLFHAGP